MGSRAASSWKHFIQLVDQVPQAADPISLFDRMLVCKNTELDNLPPCSPAEWEALVLKKEGKTHVRSCSARFCQMGCCPLCGWWRSQVNMPWLAVESMPTVFNTCLLLHS